jgi:hypothetical protein
MALKDPASVVDFQIDWTLWLDVGDAISTSSWTVPAGVTQDSSSYTTSAATVWLSGGTAGEVYKVVNQITTTGGRTTERTIEIRCVNR